jgi:serine protease Do
MKLLTNLICAGMVMGLSAALASTAQQDTELQQALALEKTVQKVIAQSEPAIACILVSRSDLYARFGQGPRTDKSGQLGPFDAEGLKAHALFAELSAADKKAVLRKLDLAEGGQIPEASGAGAVVDDKGLILTPYHLIYGASKILVQLPGVPASYADIYAADPRSDLAVLRLLRPKLTLKAIALGDGGKAERGQFIVGLATTLSPGFRSAKPSAAWGIVSNVRQRQPVLVGSEEKGQSIHHYGTLLQTDAHMNLGASGGVLFNLKGEAIALTSALAGISGPDVAGSFAIPFDEGLRRIIAVLMKGEEVEYGFLGVSLEAASNKTEGVVLKSVTDGSPADLAGLKEGCAILAVDGVPVRDNDELLRALSTHMAGSKARLEIRKPGMAGRDKVDVVLAKYLVAGKVIASEPGARPFFRGLRVDHTSLVAQQPGFTAGVIPRGVLIGEVAPNSPAAKADLKAGLVISHVNDRAVTTPAAFYEIVLSQKGPIELTLHTSEAGQPAPKVTLP